MGQWIIFLFDTQFSPRKFLQSNQTVSRLLGTPGERSRISNVNYTIILSAHERDWVYYHLIQNELCFLSYSVSLYKNII